MAKKPPTQLERIIMSADPKKVKAAIEFMNRQIAQGGGTPKQKEVMAKINSLKTDADKLAAYVAAKDEGVLEYNYNPEKGDVPRAAQEPWTKRDQRFLNKKVDGFPEPVAGQDYPPKAPEPPVDTKKVNYDDSAPDPKQPKSTTPTKAEAYLEEVRPQFRKDIDDAKRGLKMGESIEPSEPPASTVKQQGLSIKTVPSTTKAPQVSAVDTVKDLSETIEGLKYDSEYANRAIERIKKGEKPGNIDYFKNLIKTNAEKIEKAEADLLKAKEAALKGMAGQPEPSVTQEKSIKEQLLEREARNAKLKAEREATRSGIKEMVGKPVETAPVEEALPETAKAAEPETPKQTKSKKGSRGKSKTTQAQADEAALSKMAGKAPVVETPTTPPTVLSEINRLNNEIDTIEALGDKATPQQLSDLQNKKIELEQLKTGPRGALKGESTQPSPVEPAEPETPKETKSKRFKKTKEATAPKTTAPEPTTVEPTTPEPTTPEPTTTPKTTAPTGAASNLNKTSRTKRTTTAPKTAVAPEPTTVEPTAVAEPTVTPKATTVEPTVVEPATTPKTTGVGQEQPRLFQKYLDAFGEGAVEDGTKAASGGLKRSAKYAAIKTLNNPIVKGGLKLAPAVGVGLEAPQIISDIEDEDYSTAAKHTAGAVGSFGAGVAGAKIGAGLGTLTSPVTGPFGPLLGGLAGGIAGGVYGREPAEKAFQYLNRYGEIVPRSEQDRFRESIEKLEQLRDTAKTPEEREQLEEVLRRTKAKMGGESDEKIYLSSPSKYKTETIPTTEQDKTEAQTYTRPKQLVESEKEAAKGLRSDDLIADFIGQAESRGNYKAVNKNSGAFGKYQILEKDLNGKDVHGKMVESRYGEPFKQAMADPEKQEDYFRNVLLPNYKIKAAELAKTPEAQEMGLDEFTLIGMLQLGAGNVRKYLAGNANENISKQMEYFKDKADKYKRSIGDEQAAILGLKDKEQQIQEEGRYIPYKSAQAKMDTARLGQVINRKDIDDLNAKSEMYQAYQKADPFVSRMSPAQQRIQEAETVTSDSFTPEQIRAAAISDSDEVPTKEQAAAKLAAAPTEEAKAAVEEPTTTAEPTIAPTRQRSRLEEALELQRQYEMMANMSRAAERLGRGLAGAISKVAPSKMSGGEFEESLTRMGKTGVEGAKLLDEEAIKQEESDPMSEKSKRARESLKSILRTDIPESLSYNDIKSLKFSELSIKASAAEDKEQARKQQLINHFRGELTKGGIDKLGIYARKAKSGVKLIEEAIKSPSGYKDFAAAFALLKTTQGDDSVIREAEMKLGLSLGSFPEQLKSRALQFLTGQMTSPALRKEMLDAMKLLAKKAEEQYLSAADATLSNAEQYGIPRRLLLGEDFSESLDKKEETTKKPLSLAKGKERTPGATVIMSGVKYKIGEDGRELIPLE